MKRLGFSALLLSALLGCGASGPPGSAPPWSSPSVDTPHRQLLEIVRLPQRPPLTIIVREGDPQPSLALAIETGVGPVANAALAALLKGRLAASESPVSVFSDGLGVRLHLSPEEDHLETFLRSLKEAIQRPRTTDEGAALARLALASLARNPLESPALRTLSRCRGSGAVLSSEPDLQTDFRTRQGASKFDRWQSMGMLQAPKSLAAVGPKRFTEEVRDALAASGLWAPTKTRQPSWPAATHQAYWLAEPTPNLARLDLAFFFGQATAAVARLERFETEGPAWLKLEGLGLPWTVTEVKATALPVGGCLHLRLSTSEPFEGSALFETAVRVARTIQDDVLRHELSQANGFAVSADMVAAEDPHQAAQRAAWWALSKPATQTSAFASSLGLSRGGRGGSAAPDGRKTTAESALTADYQRALSASNQAPHLTHTPQPRLANEPGQGAVWALLASPCANIHEGPNDAGLAALAALAKAAAVDEKGVTVEPWVTPDGIGLLAHGGWQSPNETPSELARRVGRALGRAFGGLPKDQNAFAVAKSSLSKVLDSDTAWAFATFAHRAAPRHPSWLAPWGDLAPQTAATASEIGARWQALLRSPLRLAVLSNVDLKQAQLLAESVDEWMLPDARRSSCSEVVAGKPGRRANIIDETGGHSGVMAIGARVPTGPQDEAMAELARAALSGEGGLLEEAMKALQGSAQLRGLGGRRAGALLVLVETPPMQLKQTRRNVLAAFAKLQTLSEAQLLRAEQRARKLQLDERRDPRARLRQLWLASPAHVAPAVAELAAWAKRHLGKSKLIQVLRKPSSTP